MIDLVVLFITSFLMNLILVFPLELLYSQYHYSSLPSYPMEELRYWALIPKRIYIPYNLII